MAHYPLPTAETVVELLNGLFGLEDATAQGSAVWVPTDKEKVSVATYIDDANNIIQIALLDLPAAASVATQLTRIPPGVVEESIKAKELSEGLPDNLREVMNIWASLLNTNETPHVRFKEIISLPPETPEIIAKLLPEVAARVDLTFDTPEYGGGKLSCLTKNI